MSDFQKFSSDVKKKKFKRIYLIYGNEDYFISKATDLITQAAVDPANRSFNLDVLDGSECTSEDVLSSALSFPFVGDKRLTIVKKFERMDKRHRVDVAAHLADVPDSSILCLVAGEIKSSEEPYKTISPVAETLIFNHLKGAELTEFLVDYARKLDKDIAPGNADFLIDLTGDSLGDLTSELEKLSLYVGDRKQIEFDDISAAVGKSRTFNIFELQRAIGQRNSPRAYEVGIKMLESGEKSVYIGFMLTRYFLNLIQVKHFAAKGLNTNEMSTRIFGRWNPFLNEYVSAARMYSMPRLRKAVATLLDADSKLKSGGYSDADALAIILSEILDSKTAEAI
ncbi:MAG TPA: DNA polymerase III subunit delta [Candidatus Kryptonia bacterium]